MFLPKEVKFFDLFDKQGENIVRAAEFYKKLVDSGNFTPENIREMILKGLENFGIILDEERNNAADTNKAECRISADNSPVKIFVIPTDEEIVGVQDIVALLAGTYDVYTKFRYIFQEKDYRNKLKTMLSKRPKAAIYAPMYFFTR